MYFFSPHSLLLCHGNVRWRGTVWRTARLADFFPAGRTGMRISCGLGVDQAQQVQASRLCCYNYLLMLLR